MKNNYFKDNEIGMETKRLATIQTHMDDSSNVISGHGFYESLYKAVDEIINDTFKYAYAIPIHPDNHYHLNKFEFDKERKIRREYKEAMLLALKKDITEDMGRITEQTKQTVYDVHETFYDIQFAHLAQEGQEKPYESQLLENFKSQTEIWLDFLMGKEQ